jgi:hypothetical protein
MPSEMINACETNSTGASVTATIEATIKEKAKLSVGTKPSNTNGLSNQGECGNSNSTNIEPIKQHQIAKYSVLTDQNVPNRQQDRSHLTSVNSYSQTDYSHLDRYSSNRSHLRSHEAKSTSQRCGQERLVKDNSSNLQQQQQNLILFFYIIA